MMTATLPAGFDELEPFVAKWAGETTAARMNTRCESDMADIQAFYNAMIVRADDAITLIDTYTLDALPADVGTLCRLVLALAQASIAVEMHRQPNAPDAPYPNSIKLMRGTAPFG